MEEIWKDIQGYEGLYQVSNDGDVISLRFDPPKHIYQTITNSGYKQVILFKNGRKERVGVHILVAQAFVDGWFEGAEVNHKDLNKINNVAENLEWLHIAKIKNINITYIIQNIKLIVAEFVEKN